jgi:two-component system OmpR family sensor kinase
MDAARSQERRYLVTLQQLFAIRATDLRTALSHACDALAQATGSDKVDAFLYDEARDTLVAMGTSAQPLSDRQKMLGLDVLPLANGGSTAHIFRTGHSFRSGNVGNDLAELRGIKEGLGVQSQLGAALDIGGRRHGVVMLASLARDFFSDLDEAFLATAVHWVAIVAERAQLVQAVETTAAAQARAASIEQTIAVLAHDLRNYLSPVALRLIHIRASADDRAAQIAEDADAALRTLDDVSALLSDLLDSARLDRGAFDLELQTVDIVRLVDDAAGALGTPEHEVVVRASGPIVVAADPRRLRQCLDNVISNAVRHSPASAPVTVTVGLARGGGGECARIEVVDEGTGVPESLMPRLFERFVSGRPEGGTGLGLYIAKRIATAHGGDVVADRYPGKGARFTLTIPALPPPAAS